MAIKSANVVARVEPDIKEKAEAIFETLGIPASTAINMFYRQVILWDGMPFRLKLQLIRPLLTEENDSAAAFLFPGLKYHSNWQVATR